MLAAAASRTDVARAPRRTPAAIIARIRPEDADGIDLKLIQLKSGAGGLTATEIARLKRALARMSTDWVLAAFGGKVLQMLPEVPEKQRRRRV